MFKRMGAAIAVGLLTLLVAAVILVTVGWKLALVTFVAGSVISSFLAIRAIKKFSDDPFGGDFFKRFGGMTGR